MNNTIPSYYSKKGYSINILEKSDHLISGLLTIDAINLNFSFTGIATFINPTLEAITFVIDWKKRKHNFYKAHTAFNGYIKQNLLGSIISLDWTMILSTYPYVETPSTTFGKSILCPDNRPELLNQVKEDDLPFPYRLTSYKHHNSTKSTHTNTDIQLL